MGPKYLLLGTIYPQLRVQGGVLEHTTLKTIPTSKGLNTIPATEAFEGDSAPASYLEGQGDLVSRSIMGIIRVTIMGYRGY